MDPRGQDGFLLLEVLISSLLVALIVTATFNGFDVATRLSADQRHHSQAALLVAESQEQLRSEPATALDALESASHSYTKTIGGTVYTITQEAHPVSSSGGTTGCKVSESNGSENGANFEIVSAATWPTLVAAKRPAVKQSSIVTPPVGSALEVDVVNGSAPAEGVAGVTATAKFLPIGSSINTAAEGTTGSEGCVVLSGLATTLATVEIKEKPNFVTETGDLQYPTKEITIAPNITTHYTVPYAEGGRIKAKFEYKASTKWEGKEVKADTFEVSNTKIPAGTSPYEIGSTAFKYATAGEENYFALTSGFAATAFTPAATKYATGDLFPFSQPWIVSAGDCPKNNTGSEAQASATFTEGSTATVSVPLSLLTVKVMIGNYVTKSSTVDSTHYEAIVTDTECEGYEAPDNATGSSLLHVQHTTSAGELENPFVPFGKQSLCIYNPTAKKTYRTSFTNLTAAGSTRTVYTGQQSSAEREAEETAAKSKRATEETEATAAKTKRATEETAMASAKTTRETKEATERSTWLSEQTSGKITKAQRETKEATQKTARISTEATEAAAKTTRTNEETAATAAKAKRTTEETEATAAKAKRTTEETEMATNKPKREKEEKEAEEKTGMTVASGQSSC